VETPTDADMPRKPLTLVAQHPEFPHLELAQRRPTAEENRHTLVAILPRIAKLGVVEHRKVPRKVLDHLNHELSATPCAGAIGHFGRPLAQ
jgi:protein involved in ribonucleotide reduction